MSTNVTSLPQRRRWAGARWSSAAERGEVRAWQERLAIALLAAMVAVCLFVVTVAADRPSFLVPPSAQHYYPSWLAGPLGGLLPQFSRSTTALTYVFSFGVLAMYAAYVLILVLVPNVRARWVLGAVLALHLVLFLAPPLALTDLFNYLNYGRMEIVHGLNPYASVPWVEPHDDPAYALSNWHHLLSPYGPMFTIMTFALVPLGVPASFWVMKAILMVSSLGTLGLVWHCARLLGRDPVRAIAFVGLNPVVLMWGLGGDHNDFITVFFIMLAFYLLLRSRATSANAPGAADAAAEVERPPTLVLATVPPPDPVASDAGPPALVTAVAPVAAVTAAVAGAPAVARTTLGFAADPSAVAPVSRRLLAGRVARALELATAGAAALRPHTERPSASVAAPALDRHAPGVEAHDPLDRDALGPDARVEPEVHIAAGPDPGPPGTDGLAAQPSSRRPAVATPELWAGAALIVAVTMKASAAILIPVLLLGLATSLRRAAHLALGMVSAAVAAGAVTYLAFGAHIPDLSTQGRLSTAESLPNLLGLLLGQGGATATLQRIIQATLVLSLLWASWWAWRRRDFVTPSAWATVALLVSLSWVLPWYVLWLLPLAALAGSRAVRRVALVFGIYLILVWVPLAGSWYAAVGFAPTQTPLGQAHQRETKFLLH